MIAEIGFFVVGEAHGSCRYSSGAQNFSIKTRYVDVRDRLLLADIDYRATNSGEHRLSFIDYRLYRCRALMELIDTLRIHIDS